MCRLIVPFLFCCGLFAYSGVYIHFLGTLALRIKQAGHIKGLYYFFCIMFQLVEGAGAFRHGHCDCHRWDLRESAGHEGTIDGINCIAQDDLPLYDLGSE